MVENLVNGGRSSWLLCFIVDELSHENFRAAGNVDRKPHMFGVDIAMASKPRIAVHTKKSLVFFPHEYLRRWFAKTLFTEKPYDLAESSGGDSLALENSPSFPTSNWQYVNRLHVPHGS